jgi:hypothetical protein
VPADDRACPGVCNARYRRKWRIHEAVRAVYLKELGRLAEGQPRPDAPREPDDIPAWGDPVWCGTCTSLIRVDLSDIEDLASMLATRPPDVRAAVDADYQQVRVKVTTRTRPSPSQGADWLDELARWMAAWEEIAKGDDQRPRRGILASERHAMISVLGDYLPEMLARREISADFGGEVQRWHAELKRLTHAAEESRHFKQPCPGCKRYTLWEYLGETYLRCINPACNAAPTREEMARAP